MTKTNCNYLERAAEYWQDGQALEAGRVIFENLPMETRPKWASRILGLVVERSSVDLPQFQHILDIANHTNEWKKAHKTFETIRFATLNLENKQYRSKDQTMLLCHLYLAELVAKVIYNSTDPPDAFDEDSGWWIPVCLKDILDLLKDGEFSKSMWLALCWRD